MAAKLLIIRLSSFGDILQCLGVPAAFKKAHLESSVHWITKKQFAELITPHPEIDQVWSYDNDSGLKGLFQIASELQKEGFTHIYDAHSNLRSHLLCTRLRAKNFVRRPKDRIKRLMLFKFGQNLFEKPFIAQNSFFTPLKPWGITAKSPPPQFFLPEGIQSKIQKKLELPDKYIALVPSAAWPMKRWPVSHWKELIKQAEDLNFVILAGPNDKFCTELLPETQTDQLVTNLAGKLSLLESCAVLSNSQMTISNDTGFLHVADQLGHPSIALIGPTAFGYPANPSVKVLERDLPCKPCSKDGRGKCSQAIFQKCLVDISAQRVLSEIRRML